MPGSPTSIACLSPKSGAVRCARLHSGVAVCLFHRHSASFRRQHSPAAPVRILMFMNASTCAVTATVALTLPVHVLLILGDGVAALALLVYIGIALPAGWSAKPARRKAAAAVLPQVLNAYTGEEHR